MGNQTKKLFEGFPPISTEQWEQVIQKDLEGADYTKKLVWKTVEGFAVKPYYRAENLNVISWLKALPAQFPFVRGNKTCGNNWLVRQDIKVDNIEEANAKATDILKKGVNALGFKLKADKKYTIEEIETLLQGINPEEIELNFFGNWHHIELLEVIQKWIDKKDFAPEKVKGSINYDPLARYSRRGVWYKNQESDFELAVKLIKMVKNMPNFNVIGVNGHIFTNAGSTISQEMAFTLSMGADYLTQMTDRGLSIEEIFSAIRFNLAVGSNYFMEIAKIRAYRLLWAHIATAYGLKPEMAKIHIHATNTLFNMSLYDPYVNMLRTTTGSMSAVLGGVDSFTVMPFDVPYEDSTVFSDRIARNQQLILKEESGFDKVADPAAGSYYIENLTLSFVKSAWELFLTTTEENGGYLAYLREGSIQEMVKASAQTREMNIATRREIILGTNQYPNFTEHLKFEPSPEVFLADDRRSQKAEIETITLFRGAQAFEKMRYETDVYSKSHKRPTAWMFIFGNLNMRKARAMFASNFFACAGYEVVDNPGFKDIQEGIAAAKATKPEIVVICSSDEEYQDNAIAIYEALKNDAVVVLAGNPAELVEKLKDAGMEYFIHVKTNVLETLQHFQKELSISK